MYDTPPAANPQCKQDYVKFLKGAIQSSHTSTSKELKECALRRKGYYDPYATEDLVHNYYPPVYQQDGTVAGGAADLRGRLPDRACL